MRPSGLEISPASVLTPPDAQERRQSGRRARARDRLMDRAVKDYPRTDTLPGSLEVENLLLFIDDDLREAAKAMSAVETYLVGVLGLLEGAEVQRRDVQVLSGEAEVLDQLDTLAETVESLRRRLGKLAACIRG